MLIESKTSCAVMSSFTMGSDAFESSVVDCNAKNLFSKLTFSVSSVTVVPVSERSTCILLLFRDLFDNCLIHFHQSLLAN